VSVPAPAELLAVVEQSPAFAAAHDRSGWVNLFSDDGSVEDPVGSRRHTGHAAIGRFYDTFIGPRDIVFHRDLDIVAGSTVLRSLTLQVGMGGGVTMEIPAYLRYVVVESTGEPKIAELQAFWELPAMVWQFASNGIAALGPGLRLTRALLTNQNPVGALGFAAGARRPGARQRAALNTLTTALTRGDELAVRRILGRGVAVNLGDDTAVSADGIGALLRGATWTKHIAAGRYIAVAVRTDTARGVLIAEFGAGAQVVGLRYFTPS
jgi:hypothetical protein